MPHFCAQCQQVVAGDERHAIHQPYEDDPPANIDKINTLRKCVVIFRSEARKMLGLPTE